MEQQKLILAEDVFDALEFGKVCTIRKGRRDIKLGDLLFESLEHKRTKVVNVYSVIYCQLKDTPDAYVSNDGFDDHEDMLEKMKRFYPDIEDTSECTIVVFEN